MTPQKGIESRPEVSGVDRNQKSRGDEEREIRKSLSFAFRRRMVRTGLWSLEWDSDIVVTMLKGTII